ncbi:MAG TPA: CheB methylesterase domain-containing protein [Methylovirgula sp.]|nr:CheB methylesterase domain-containing protein [Methylovirgula sp.]
MKTLFADQPMEAHCFSRGMDALRASRNFPRAIVIGASTGGPQAVPVVLRGLIPVIEHVCVFVALHIPPQFTDTIAENIGKTTHIPTHAARHGEQVAKGRIYVSPGHLHLGVARIGESVVIALSDAPPENFCKPSVDFLFRTASLAYGADAIGVVLTGMGKDGLAGSRAIVDAGGRIIAQDAASSAVWGMPGSVAREGLAHAVLPLESIGPALCLLFASAAARGEQ